MSSMDKFPGPVSSQERPVVGSKTGAGDSCATGAKTNKEKT